jgi:hypothetical protein
MALDLVCFATFHAKSKLSISNCVGTLFVTIFRSLVCKTLLSRVWTSIPPEIDFISNPFSWGIGIDPDAKILTLGLSLKIWSASLVKEGAIITSKNKDFICFAKSRVNSLFKATIPPNALIGSVCSAFSHAKFIFAFSATPQGLACLIIAIAGWLNSQINS